MVRAYDDNGNVVDLVEWEKQIRADAIDECTDKFADILSNMKQICGINCPVNCNWGTSESCKSMMKKWLLEQFKERENEY